MSKLEEVAKAIYERRNGPGCKPWSRQPANHQFSYFGDAGAAIEALREPSEAMTKAACVEADKHGYYHTRGYFDVDEARYAWTSMIDSILTEAPTHE